MREQYPFFREEDERTAAIIGEEAIDADLNGEYQKPYAVLTQKRLYCKNERGNFIVGAAQLTGTRMHQNNSPFMWLLWAAFGVDVFRTLWHLFSAYRNYFDMSGLYRSTVREIVVTVICLVIFLVTRKKLPKIAPILFCIHPGYHLICDIVYYAIGNLWWYVDIIYLLWMVLPIVFVIVYYIKSGNQNSNFEVLCTGGAFYFMPSLYPAEELAQFAEQVKLVQSGETDGE